MYEEVKSMLTIQCTKKLADYLNKDISNKPNEGIDMFYSWHAHLFVIQRKKYIVVMNSVTRYNFVLGPVMAKDLKSLDNMIFDGIRDNLDADRVSEELIDLYCKEMHGIEYMKTSERSIVGQINDVIFYIECVYETNGELDIDQLNRSLNHFVMLKLPLTYSRETMIHELENRFSVTNKI